MVRLPPWSTAWRPASPAQGGAEATRLALSAPTPPSSLLRCWERRAPGWSSLRWIRHCPGHRWPRGSRDWRRGRFSSAQPRSETPQARRTEFRHGNSASISPPVGSRRLPSNPGQGQCNTSDARGLSSRTTTVHGICSTYELGPEDATVAAMPLFHGHGLLAVLLASLASGGCVLLPERGRFSAHTFWDDARTVAATWFTAVPTIHEILLQRAVREYPGPAVVPLRFVRSCSAPLNMVTAQAMERTFGAPVLSAYGMTETAHQATSEPLPLRGPLKHGSVGRPTGVDIRIVDEHGHSCPIGAVGEVWVHGPTVTRGYLANPAETALSFADGWFRTGDLGSLDEDGYLFLTGRIKNLINRGGEKISPEHVEAILAGCDGVIEAAVFAIPDATYGERVGAAVVVSPPESVGPDQILESCRSQLAPFEIPDRLEVVGGLPHTAKGALDRRAVQDQYAH